MLVIQTVQFDHQEKNDRFRCGSTGVLHRWAVIGCMRERHLYWCDT